ncbi:hypothetical protein K435DRAFT_869872 [Dendrothele bispora CBS 962.96]|uniref:Ion transport domain-containing protein n=1 Tax=Dendrothele bispora (strain CBS 962.96) TaxID=1314807 RepID=A0A4S8L821_DENBC|nr:hypothetical protein K435DRAFT_869872 [Dendrothele bispora CBS 962.96]
MISVGLVLAGLALFALFFGPSSKSAVSLTPFGCHTNLDFLPHAAQEAASWEALFVYDVLLFIMLVRRGYKVYRSSQRIPILDIILRDGASYFVVMALANLANIFTFYLAGPYTRGGLSTFSSVSKFKLLKPWSMFPQPHLSHKQNISDNDLPTHPQSSRQSNSEPKSRVHQIEQYTSRTTRIEQLKHRFVECIVIVNVNVNVHELTA